MKRHFQQIDILKGLAIVAVLLLHSLSREQLENSLAVFHIWQAVPVFLVLMGLNLGLSNSPKNHCLRQLYTAAYVRKKAARILLPLLLMYVLALVAGYVWQRVYLREVYTLGWENLIGVLPVSGKGNYFITLLLQSLLLLPLIGYTFKRWPVRTSLLLLALEIGFQLLANQLTYFDQDRYLYDASFLRYLSAVVLGLWLARLVGIAPAWQNIIVAVAGLTSAVYLYLLGYQGVALPPFRPEWQLQVFLTFPYAALLVLLGMLLFPHNSRRLWARGLALVGQASYHIFLAQVLYFGLVRDDSNLLGNLSICLASGLLFYFAEAALTEKRATKPAKTRV